MFNKAFLVFSIWFGSMVAAAQQHPSIMLTKQKLPTVIQGIKQYPLLKKSFEELKKFADAGMATAISVPVPKEAGGGFTHEQHKRNYQYILAAATVYQLTKEKKYAGFVKELLLAYASQYSNWPLHPQRKTSNAAGRIFWQILNDCVWQVYVIQGYDLVYDFLSASERNTIEKSLLIPAVKFIMEENTTTFNRIHNHGTWAVAAVGMTGYVLNIRSMTESALKGSKLDGKTGFLSQVEQLFSPDGYYAEGPYYQRYALLPFILFAKTIHQYEPKLKIFSYNNSVLKKAIHNSLQLTYTNGAFFPINDAIKDKTFESEELVYAVDIAYSDIEPAADLLDVASKQNRVIISDAGLEVAKAIAAGKTKPFLYKDLWIRDGNKGDKGGIGILRSGSNEDQQCIVLKAGSQGMGHGHFDRLNLLYYDHGVEVFSDYGSARFLNIETKSGGDYLPENKTWAKQTVAHNTVVVDQTSHYDANVKKAEASAPQLVYFNSTKEYKVVTARESNAYPGVDLIRTIALINIKELEKPLLIDVYKIRSNKDHQYDLPYWYQGQITNTTNIETVRGNDSFKSQVQLAGNKNGYEHIWVTKHGASDNTNASITFLNNRRFYTSTFLTDTATSIDFILLGANDPEFNLRNEKGFMLSRYKTKDQLFVTLVESHGVTNPIAETASASRGKIHSLKKTSDTNDTSSFEFSIDKKIYSITINYNNPSSFLTLNPKP